jgi:hypothetical protein
MNRMLLSNHYVVVRDFIPKYAAEQFASAFLSDTHKKCVPDPNFPDIVNVYNYLPFVRLLVSKIPQVSEILGEPVLPTYVYSRIYEQGNVLVRHVDRPACEISLTLNLRKNADWPIYIERPDGTAVAVELEPGDAVMYMGCEAPHWREAFNGSQYLQVFMHYVRANGDKAWSFFDIQKQQLPTPTDNKLPVTIL